MLTPRVPFRTKSSSPMMMMNTAVPLPLRTIVLSIKQSIPMNNAGTITCAASSIGGTSTTSQLVTVARKHVSTKQMTYEIASRSSHTLYR